MSTDPYTVLAALALGTALVAALRGTWSPCGLSMVSAINPMSETARGYSYPVTCCFFVAGSTAAGAVLGAVAAAGASALALVPLDVRLVLAAAAAAVCLAAELKVPGVRLPLHPRQVNERWLDTYRRWVYASGFGAQIGLGFATYVMSASTYLFVALGVLTGSPAVALSVAAAFGLVRGLAVLLTARSRTPGALLVLHQRLERLAPVSVRCAQAWLGLCLLLLTGAVGGVAGAAIVAAGVAVAVAVTSRTGAGHGTPRPLRA